MAKVDSGPKQIGEEVAALSVRVRMVAAKVRHYPSQGLTLYAR